MFKARDKWRGREAIHHPRRLSCIWYNQRSLKTTVYLAHEDDLPVYESLRPAFHSAGTRSRPEAQMVSIAAKSCSVRSALAQLPHMSPVGNQFETKLSSGSLSAFADGARDAWENSLFGGAYHVEGVTNLERPKYGALELIRFPDGPIPRFGSCYFVLRQNLAERTSFTFMGQ